ncbi:MAG: protein-glutamine glutaminase family protein [Alphaproteobacteria bacterium]
MIPNLRELYGLLEKVPQLVSTDPRMGCIARAQIVGSLLHQRGLRVGRAWILPMFERVNFYAPLYDMKGKPLKDAAHKSRAARWRYHCSACLLDFPGDWVVDFPLFAAPIRASAWHEAFIETQSRYARGQGIELRLAVLPFHELPPRQVLRDNPKAQKQNRFLTVERLAKLVSFSPIKIPPEPVLFKPNPVSPRR